MYVCAPRPINVGLSSSYLFGSGVCKCTVLDAVEPHSYSVYRYRGTS